MSKPDVTPEKRAKILNQVRVLLDIAERETTPAGEAASARVKAEQFMRDYRIEEEQALAVDPASLAPEWREVILCGHDSAFTQDYVNLLAYVSEHVGTRVRFAYAAGQVVGTTVGYRFDLDLQDMMFTAARLVFSEHLEPRVDPSLTDQVNAYRLRRAGIPRNRVANLLWGASEGSDGAPAHGRVAKLYKAECAARGEDAALNGRGISAEVYRKAYARSFTTRVYTRLADARRATERTSGGIQLHGRAERVDEAFYERYPERRPTPVRAEDSAPCVACAKAKHASGKCRTHRHRPPSSAERARYVRSHSSPEALSGAAAGRVAAEAVDVGGSAPVRRIDDRSEDERETTRGIQGVLGR